MISNTNEVKDYKELIVWQKGIGLVLEVYSITKRLPSEERFGLCSQMQRAAVAIPSNIAEGASRNHTNEFRQFLGIAYGSAAELETQMIIVKKIYPDISCEKAEGLNQEILKMINSLINKLQ